MMMGQRSVGQEQLFYSFNLEEHVPQDHLLREIDPFLDLGDLRRHLAEFYSHTGRPSSDVCAKRCILTLPTAGSAAWV